MAGGERIVTAGRGDIPPSRLALLDLLRLLAALAVVGYHYLYRGAQEGGFLDTSFGRAGDVLSLGYLGVNLFFMISGFVIIWSASGRDWYGFAVGRIARLYPAHLVAMTLTALVMLLWSAPPFTVNLTQWFANLTMLAPLLGQPFMDGAYWSIALEIIFYGWVTLGLMTGILPRQTDRFVAAWLAIVLLNGLVIGSSVLELLFVTRYGACFCFGIMVWRVLAEGPAPLRMGLLGLSMMLTFLSAEWQRLEVLEAYGEASTPTMVAGANLAVIALFCVAIFAQRHVRQSPFLVTAGALSYPLYLIHQNAGYIVINAAAPHIGKWAAVAFAVVVALAAAWAISRFVEPLGRAVIRTIFDPVGRSRPRRRSERIVAAE